MTNSEKREREQRIDYLLDFLRAFVRAHSQGADLVQLERSLDKLEDYADGDC